MAWSGLLVLVAKCVGKLSLPESDLIVLLFALQSNGGFWYTSVV